MLELLKRNIIIRSTERQNRNESLNLTCPGYTRESEGVGTFQVSATRFGIHFPTKLRVAQV